MSEEKQVQSGSRVNVRGAEKENRHLYTAKSPAHHICIGYRDKERERDPTRICPFTTVLAQEICPLAVRGPWGRLLRPVHIEPSRDAAYPRARHGIRVSPE